MSAWGIKFIICVETGYHFDSERASERAILKDRNLTFMFMTLRG